MIDIKVSVAIPTYDYNGRGGKFIADLFHTILKQKGFEYSEIEVIVSDHSIHSQNDVKSTCLWHEANTDLTIKYHRNKENIGNSPANLNKVISICKGTVIKIMFQDDFFYDTGALKSIYDELFENEDTQWLVCGCNHTSNDGHTFYRDMMPQWNENILKGVNTISSPSVVAIKNGTKIKFDEKLVMMMDCDFYYAMDRKYGQPIYLFENLVTNRVHKQQISYQFNENKKGRNMKLKKEIDYCFTKYQKKL